MTFDRSFLRDGVTRVADAGIALESARDALRGQSATLSATDAIQLIADSSFPNRHRDLQTVLEDEDAPARLRMLAAVGLARCDRDAALEILIRASATKEPLVLGGVFRALGQIGDERALDAITRALSHGDTRSRTQGEFARLLITHRLGLADRATATPEPGEALDLAQGCGQRILIRPARAHVAAQTLASLGARPYGIELAERPMVEFICDRCRGTILFNRDYTRRDALSVLRKRPALFGIGALASERRNEFSAAALILTTPEPGGARVRISIHLTNGERLFAGVAEVGERDAEWTLRAVRRMGAFPIRAQGTFAGGALRIDEAASGVRVVQQRRLSPIEVGRPPREVNLRPMPAWE